MQKIVSLLSLLVLTGCFPMRYAANPGARGLIVDERTRAPIVGAEVFRSTAKYSFYVFTNETVEGVAAESKTAPPPQPPPLDTALRELYPPVVYTDTGGRFEISPTKQWMLYIVPMDVGKAYSTLVVRADGYMPELRFVATHSTADIGVVPLKRKE